MKIGYVYMITSPSGRIYVGSTKNIEYRWGRYKKLNCKQQRKLYNSFIKYGVENHVFEVLWSGNVEDMLMYECLIGIYFCVLDRNKGMNLRLPGYNDKPTIFSKETRLRISISMMGKVAKNKGKSPSNETKQKMSDSAKKRKVKPFLNKIAKENSRKASMRPLLCEVTGKEFESIKEAGKYYNLTPSYITAQLKGRMNKKLTLVYK